MEEGIHRNKDLLSYGFQAKQVLTVGTGQHPDCLGLGVQCRGADPSGCQLLQGCPGRSDDCPYLCYPLPQACVPHVAAGGTKVLISVSRKLAKGKVNKKGVASGRAHLPCSGVALKVPGAVPTLSNGPEARNAPSWQGEGPYALRPKGTIQKPLVVSCPRLLRSCAHSACCPLVSAARGQARPSPRLSLRTANGAAPASPSYPGHAPHSALANGTAQSAPPRHAPGTLVGPGAGRCPRGCREGLGRAVCQVSPGHCSGSRAPPKFSRELRDARRKQPESAPRGSECGRRPGTLRVTRTPGLPTKGAAQALHSLQSLVCMPGGAWNLGTLIEIRSGE
uniref:uncharacterized protein LOC103790675 n=1 Tax=Callithrix jacchus TaxID=9483 RepID=UPI0023DD082E|nr:uncharacterized protein LOC103790675 [Callithrix jacchus]